MGEHQNVNGGEKGLILIQKATETWIDYKMLLKINPSQHIVDQKKRASIQISGIKSGAILLGNQVQGYMTSSRTNHLFRNA